MRSFSNVSTEALVPLQRETSRIGQTINSTETKHMVAGRHRVEPSCIGDEDVFEVVKEFLHRICDM